MSGPVEKASGNALSDLVDDLVLANRILAKHDVLDTYGHISIRSPADPNVFLLAMRKSPALVTRKDVVALSIKTGDPVTYDGKRAIGPSERHIHAALYRSRPDVDAVLHCHAPILVSYSILPPWIPGLRPVIHVGACTGHGPVPVYDMAEKWGPDTNLLVATPELSDDLANTFMQHEATDMVLMHGHGATIVSSTGIRNLVHKGLYAVINANILKDARLMMQSVTDGSAHSGIDVKYLSEGEAATCKDGAVYVARSWEVWKDELHLDYGTDRLSNDPWA